MLGRKCRVINKNKKKYIYERKRHEIWGFACCLIELFLCDELYVNPQYLIYVDGSMKIHFDNVAVNIDWFCVNYISRTPNTY